MNLYAMKDILEDAQNKGFAVNKRIRIILGLRFCPMKKVF